MKMILDIKNPAYTSHENFIDCDILFDGESEYVRYTTSSTDSTSANLYDQLSTGQFGNVLPFIPYVPTLQEIKKQRLLKLAAYRYSKETEGITLNGAVIKTDVGSQSKINGAWSAAQMNPTILIDWKGENGWVQIDAATITAIAMSVATHVQACFSNERVHSDVINALETAEAVQTYDFTTGWPQ